MNHNPTPMKAQFLPLFNVNLSQPQLNSTSTQFQLNFEKTSSQPHFNDSLKSTSASISTSTLTSTQYGCDIKAIQSCYLLFYHNVSPSLFIFKLEIWRVQRTQMPPLNAIRNPFNMIELNIVPKPICIYIMNKFRPLT